MIAGRQNDLGAIAIVAPGGRDAQVIGSILRSAGIDSTPFKVADLLDGIVDARFAAAVVAEEAISGVAPTAISRAVEQQPPWSDFPFIVLTRRGRLSPSNPAVHAMGNVTEVERPVHPATLLASVRSVLRARTRQQETRDHLAARQAAEAKMATLAQSLERHVQARTAALDALNVRLRKEIAERIAAEERLQQMQAELIHVSRLSAMGTMASTLAHELNQPLSAILSYMQGVSRLLSTTPNIPDDLVAAVDAVATNAHRAGGIIRRLREQVTHRPLTRKPESLRSLIEEAQVLGLIDISLRDVTCRIDIGVDADEVLVDRIQMQQVLINLIRNAVEAVEGCERREIIVSTDGAETQISVDVADTGQGLPDHLLPLLFFPFRTTKAGGMGLGLSICRIIVEDHGGTIHAFNRPEGGAVVRLLLPVAESMQVKAGTSETSRP